MLLQKYSQPMTLLVFLLAVHLMANDGKCYLHFPYLNTPTTDDAGFVVTFTAKGIRSFIKHISSTIEQSLENLAIPDKHFEVDLKITTLSLDIRNILLDDVHLGNCSFSLLEDGDANRVALENASIRVVFGYALKQLTAPYLSDEGIGKVSFANMGIFAQVQLNISPYCAFHKRVLVSDLSADIGMLNLSLESWVSPVITPFLNLISPALKAFLEGLFPVVTNDMLNIYLGDILEREITCKREFEFLTSDNMSNLYCMDSRTLGFVTTRDYVAVRYPGQTYHAVIDSANATNFLDNTTVELQPGPIQRLPDILDNDDVQYIIDRSALNSAFHTWHKFERAYDCILNASIVEAEGYLSIASLALAFPNVGNFVSATDEISIVVSNLAAPFIKSVEYTGLMTVLELDLNIRAGEETLAHVRANVYALSSLALFSLYDTAGQNITDFYITFQQNTVETVVAALREGLLVSEENLDAYATDLFTDVVGPIVSLASKKRSPLTDNSFFFDQRPYSVHFYPPEYCSVSLNIEG